MNSSDKKFLFELLSRPTAPFKEQHVATLAQAFLDKYNIPFFSDPVGNIVIGVKSKSQYKQLLRKTEPARLFMAHMDHPGFHGSRWLNNRRLQVKWHGGTPVKHVAGASVYLADDNGVFAEGKLSRIKLVKGKWAMASAEVVLPSAPDKQPAARSVFGAFRFRKPVWQQGKRIYTNAADDLGGVFTILQMAKRLRKQAVPFIGLLTRGEEVGFVGAISHFELGWLNNYKCKPVIVSLEASRTLAGAVIGKGPVVRLGDRRTVFNADALKVLSDVAERILPGRHQKRIMDGGSCEATAATVYGLTTIGITLPLGNYHNQGLEGGPDCRGKAGPAPEFIHIDDLDAELKLCLGLMQAGLPWHKPWHKQEKLLKKNMNKYRRLLARKIM